MTIDQWRAFVLAKGEDGVSNLMNSLDGFVCIAGAVVPGKYLRGTPISIKETKDIVRKLPLGIPAILGGWAIRGWRQQGWTPLRKNLFLALQDTDATLDNFLKTEQIKELQHNIQIKHLL